jgi:hypothetical protein
MYSVELYAKIRRAVMVESKSEREVARLFGLHRNTIKKMCAYAAPPGCGRSKATASPKLAPFAPIIDAIVATDKTVHVKQRHTGYSSDCVTNMALGSATPSCANTWVFGQPEMSDQKLRYLAISFGLSLRGLLAVNRRFSGMKYL